MKANFIHTKQKHMHTPVILYLKTKVPGVSLKRKLKGVTLSSVPSHLPCGLSLLMFLMKIDGTEEKG